MTTNSGPSHAYCFEEATGNSLVNQEARLPPQRYAFDRFQFLKLGF